MLDIVLMPGGGGGGGAGGELQVHACSNCSTATGGIPDEWVIPIEQLLIVVTTAQSDFFLIVPTSRGPCAFGGTAKPCLGQLFY